MRKATLLLAVLGLAGSLCAADPIIGTWKFNTAKSTCTLNAPPLLKEYTEVYSYLTTGEIELTLKSIGNDGSSVLLVLTWPTQGGAVKMIKGDLPKNISWTQTLIGEEWYVTAMRDGKQVGTRHKIASKDGKILRQILRETDAKRKPFECILVFDRQ